MQKNPKRFVLVALILITGSFLYGVFMAGLFLVERHFHYEFQMLNPLMPCSIWNTFFHPAIVLLILGFLFVIWHSTKRG